MRPTPKDQKETKRRRENEGVVVEGCLYSGLEDVAGFVRTEDIVWDV